MKLTSRLLLFFLALVPRAEAGTLPPGFSLVDSLLADRATPVDSVADLIPLLPEELRRNFTFVYQSRSPFAASITPAHPRVILFSADARLVLTFTGNPKRPGFDILEAMAFDDESSSFRFKAYVLPAATRRGVKLDDKQRDCLRCHGADPRPIFDSYPLWPGFYGSIQDSFPKWLPFGRREQTKYEAFLAKAAKKGVYKDLLYPEGSPVSPYVDPKVFSREKPEGELGFFPHMPNTRLGMALTELNRARIFRLLSAGPYYARNERAILAELLDCGGPRISHRATNAVREAIEVENEARLKRLGVNPKDPAQRMNDMLELGDARALAQLEKAAALAGVSMAGWSMAMEDGSYSFFDGILSGIHEGRSYYLKEDLILEALKALQARDPAYRPFFRVDAVYAKEGYPFGNRLDLGLALGACPLLTAKAPPTAP